ncbi:MAG: hypothetical protein K2M94_05215 [Paramuribaculum sp.]|nr:hypothetical protein [Paramuribaculum sp.]
MVPIINNGKGIFQLWLNWLMGCGAIALLIVLSLWVTPRLIPFIAFGLQFLFFLLIKRNRQSKHPVCYLVPFIVSRILFWTGIITLTINLLYRFDIMGRLFTTEEVNPSIPFIATLIIAPISALITIWGKIYKRKLSFCKDCSMQFGTTAERGFLGMIFTQEGQYQLTMLFYMSIGCTVLSWSYYGLMYVNVNLNTPDKFIFFGVPLLLWIFSSFYLALRYFGIWSYYCQNSDIATRRLSISTLVRYIMVHDNKICLRRPDMNPDTMVNTDFKYDIPGSHYLSYREFVNLSDATRMFTSFTGIKNPDVRFMYISNVGNADCNIFHFLCYIDDEQKAKFDAENPQCLWLDFREVGTLLNNHELNMLLSAEITRMHTMALAWKTYTPDGKRRYKIKEYRPTFQFRDLKNLNIDFNDKRWIYVANNNQDVPFYALRRFWRKHINGVGNAYPKQ